MKQAPLTLSKVRLSLRRGGGEAERRSTAAYLIHQAVADLFGDHEKRDYLYRVLSEWPGGRELLVLSRTLPHAAEEVSSPTHRRAIRVESRSYEPTFTAGQLLDFEIRLNATAVVSAPGRKESERPRKRRVDVWESVWGRDKQTSLSQVSVYSDYLSRKLTAVAEVLDAAITERGEVQARRGDVPEPIRFVATNVIGTLRVTDPEGLPPLISNGIGRSKAFGCGLLLVSHPGTILARRYPERAAELL
jgi:CRISPR system Cascade subunit CasE